MFQEVLELDLRWTGSGFVILASEVPFLSFVVSQEQVEHYSPLMLVFVPPHSLQLSLS